MGERVPLGTDEHLNTFDGQLEAFGEAMGRILEFEALLLTLGLDAEVGGHVLQLVNGGRRKPPRDFVVGSAHDGDLLIERGQYRRAKRFCQGFFEKSLGR